MSTALVTGATSGIGAEFARQLAARGCDLVLVARNTDRLNATAAELSQAHGVRCEVLSADLSVRDDVARVAARAEDPDRPIDWCINNAGFGVHSPLLDPDTGRHEQAFAVMCTAVLVIGGAAARAMSRRGHGRIVNVSSSAAFITMGNYSALKAWVSVYTEGLSVELAGTGVTATALCPGWVHTEFHERAEINASKIPEVAWIDVDRLVREGLADAERGRVLSVPTRRWAAATTLARVVPRPVIRRISGMLSSSRRPKTG